MHNYKSFLILFDYRYDSYYVDLITGDLKKSIAYKIKMERNNIKIQREHLIHAMSGKIREMKLNIDKAVITLKENNPTNVLSKGYALVTKNDIVVSDMSNIALDEIYTIVMADGSFEAKTTSKTQN